MQLQTSSRPAPTDR